VDDQVNWWMLGVVAFTFVLAFAITFFFIEALDRWTRASEGSKAAKAPSSALLRQSSQRTAFERRTNGRPTRWANGSRTNRRPNG
jgi:hypothetical protein